MKFLSCIYSITKVLKSFLLIIFLFTALFGIAQSPPLVSDSLVSVFDTELSGESAKRNLEYITRLHRMRGSAEFKKAIDVIKDKLKEYGLEEVETIQLPADGKTMH